MRHRELRAGIERERICAAEGCAVEFYAKRANTRFCSRRCGTREAQRRYSQTEKGKQYRQDWLAQNADKPSRYSADWYERHGKGVRAAYKKDNRLKLRAHSKVSRAIRNGALLRQPCEVCGNPQVDAHHSDYTQPLEVRWLCREHHIALHAKGVVTSQRS